MRLLLVEDEHDIQAFLRRSLEEAGYQVDAASDGKTAERLATENAYDILVVDLGPAGLRWNQPDPASAADWCEGAGADFVGAAIGG